MTIIVRVFVLLFTLIIAGYHCYYWSQPHNENTYFFNRIYHYFWIQLPYIVFGALLFQKHTAFDIARKGLYHFYLKNIMTLLKLAVLYPLLPVIPCLVWNHEQPPTLILGIYLACVANLLLLNSLILWIGKIIRSSFLGNSLLVITLLSIQLIFRANSPTFDQFINWLNPEVIDNFSQLLSASLLNIGLSFVFLAFYVFTCMRSDFIDSTI
ncbi:hypothetical protein RR47_GL001985 [Enterococcus columbae DSM 7374 = ATCC 51263]|nr:hypothetical protein RR47_GL001985 [Enterococcus columbae DSM 7374 = ATCC 51263]